MVTDGVRAAKKAAVDEALNLAEELAENRIDPTDLEVAAVAAVRELAAVVVGPGDPVWELQVQVCRDVLAVGGVPADELAEWAAVQAQVEGVGDAPVVSWIEVALAAGADDDAHDAE